MSVKTWAATQGVFLKAVQDYVEIVELKKVRDVTVDELFEYMLIVAKHIEDEAK